MTTMIMADTTTSFGEVNRIRFVITYAMLIIKLLVDHVN